VTGFQGVYEQQIRIVGQIGGGGGGGGGGGNRYSGKTVPYEKGMTLLDLIIIIGQIGWYADGNRASIIRNVNGKPQRFGVRMDDLVEDADMSLNVKIMPGDILVIPEAFF
jgi:polysaccharide export outer membrane protein